MSNTTVNPSLPHPRANSGAPNAFGEIADAGNPPSESLRTGDRFSGCDGHDSDDHEENDLTTMCDNVCAE